MIDDRNLTYHTYHEEVAEEIFINLKDYLEVMKKNFINNKRLK